MMVETFYASPELPMKVVVVMAFSLGTFSTDNTAVTMQQEGMHPSLQQTEVAET